MNQGMDLYFIWDYICFFYSEMELNDGHSIQLLRAAKNI